MQTLSEMKQTKIILLIAVISIFTYGCSEQNKQNSNDNILTATVIPVGEIARQIAGTGYKVNVMVPDGMPPSAYEPSPLQLKDLENTALYFSLQALEFEQTVLPNISKNYQDMQIIDISKGIIPAEESCGHNHDHHEGHHHGHDPHMWMSPRQVKKIAENIHISLTKRFPEDKSQFDENLGKLMTTVKRTDSLAESELAKLNDRSFMIYHPALTYFARDYHLEQIPVELEGKEPSPEYLKHIIDKAIAENIHVIFIQRQFDRKYADLIAQEADMKVVIIDPLSENMQETIEIIVDALKD